MSHSLHSGGLTIKGKRDKKRPEDLMRKSNVTKASVSSSDEGKKAEDGWRDG